MRDFLLSIIYTVDVNRDVKGEYIIRQIGIANKIWFVIICCIKIFIKKMSVDTNQFHTEIPTFKSR